MIAYSLKTVLELVPEALPMVKQAHIEQEWPMQSKDDCLASALVAEYQKSQGKIVDYDALTKLASVTEMYGLEEDVARFSDLMAKRMRSSLQKTASAPSTEKYMEKQAQWGAGQAGFKNVEELAKQAQELYEYAASVGAQPSEDVQKYSGHALLSKQAALNSLNARYWASKDPVLLKLASAIGQHSPQAEFISDTRLVQDLCRTITGLDKKAGLSVKGFDIYQEALFTKEAAAGSSTVKVAGKDYPLQKVQMLPQEHVKHYLGDDVAQGLDSDPVTAKAVIESLPLDMQHLLVTLLKSA